MSSLSSPSDFIEPPWSAPIDFQATLRAIPPNATVAGMFLDNMVQAARRIGVKLPSARDRYIPFSFYPLREHVQLLQEACERFYSELSPRAALRKLGRAAPKALVTSSLGRVVLGSTDNPESALRSMATTYAINLRPSHGEVLESSPGRVVVRLRSVYFFLDSHHVAVFEGTLTYAGVRGNVRIRPLSSTSADLLCTWVPGRTSLAPASS